MSDTPAINWTPIFDFIAQAHLTDWDKEGVAAAVVKAWETWAEEDIRDEIIGTELRGDNPFPYCVDLLLRHGIGYRVGDWKTKRPGKLDERWAERERRSWQPKIYGAAVATLYGREVFPLKYEVRGITLEDSPKTQTLSFVVTQQQAIEACRYLKQLERVKQQLLACNSVPWPRNPEGCRCFGPSYPCDFEKYCWDGAKRPVGEMERVLKPFSHSSAKEFLRCPERYRLERIINKPDDEEDVAAPGRAFHEAMEMVYKQIQGEREL